LVAAIRRAREPGHKFDICVTLIGPQGIGKSTYWAHLLPPEARGQWFSDAANPALDDGRLVEATAGRVFCELADLQGIDRADRQRLKAWQTRDTDSYRLAYRRTRSDLKRTFIVVGTSNPSTLLPNDPDGMRRWLPVECTAGNRGEVAARLRSDREQLWAEAAHHEADGAPIHYTDPALEAAAAAAGERWRTSDVEAEDIFTAAVEQHAEPTGDGAERIAFQDIKAYAQTAGCDRHNNTWVRMLTADGWRKQPDRKVKGERISYWTRPAG